MVFYYMEKYMVKKEKTKEISIENLIKKYAKKIIVSAEKKRDYSIGDADSEWKFTFDDEVNPHFSLLKYNQKRENRVYGYYWIINSDESGDCYFDGISSYTFFRKGNFDNTGSDKNNKKIVKMFKDNLEEYGLFKYFDILLEEKYDSENGEEYIDFATNPKLEVTEEDELNLVAGYIIIYLTFKEIREKWGYCAVNNWF